MGEKLEGLTKPLRLGRLQIKNRVWNSPLWTRTATVNGEISDRTIAHYVARARGGCGVIATEACAVDGDHHWLTPQIAIWDEVFLPGHRRLVEAVHAYNAPIICQLHHAGMFGNDPVSPSGVPCADLGKIGVFIEPRILSTQEVEVIRDKFIAAACRAQAVGYDGVEFMGRQPICWSSSSHRIITSEMTNMAVHWKNVWSLRWKLYAASARLADRIISSATAARTVTG